MQDLYDALNTGCYKIRLSNLKKIIGSTVTSNAGKTISSVSNNELLLYIHLSHIADQKGIISDFKVKQIMTVLDCPLKSCYLALEGLVKKCFITMTERTWSGVYTIQMIDNDFSNVKNYKDARNYYLDTNISYLHYNSQYYSLFKSLCLNEKKTFLYLLYNYDSKYGYRNQCRALKEALGVKRNAKVAYYLMKIKEKICGSDLFITPDKDSRLKYGRFYLKKGCPYFVKESEIFSEFDTYFKRKIYLFTQKNNISISSASSKQYSSNYHMCMDFASQIYGMIHSLKDKCDFKQLISSVSDILLDEMKLDEITIHKISSRMNTLACST